MKAALETSGTALNTPTGPRRPGPRRREREKGPKKISEEITAEKFSNMGKEIVN